MSTEVSCFSFCFSSGDLSPLLNCSRSEINWTLILGGIRQQLHPEKNVRYESMNLTLACDWWSKIKTTTYYWIVTSTFGCDWIKPKNTPVDCHILALRTISSDVFKLSTDYYHMLSKTLRCPFTAFLHHINQWTAIITLVKCMLRHNEATFPQYSATDFKDGRSLVPHLHYQSST